MSRYKIRGGMQIDQTPRWEVLRERPAARIVHCGPLVCVAFTEASTDAELHADFDAQEAVIEKWGSISQIVTFQDFSIGFSSRALASERLKQWGERLRCAAVVLEGTGLGAQLVRVAAMSVVAFSRQSSRHKLFSSLVPAVEWVKSWPEQPPIVHDATHHSLLVALGRK